MARQQKFFARASHGQRVYPLDLVAGETLRVEIDWNQILGEFDSTISRTCWGTDGSLIGITDQGIVDGKTRVLVTANDAGSQLLENCITLADGQSMTRHWYCKVRDPQTEPLVIGDYQTV